MAIHLQIVFTDEVSGRLYIASWQHTLVLLGSEAMRCKGGPWPAWEPDTSPPLQSLLREQRVAAFPEEASCCCLGQEHHITITLPSHLQVSQPRAISPVRVGGGQGFVENACPSVGPVPELSHLFYFRSARTHPASPLLGRHRFLLGY
ncbi:hypothetical protein KIL84_014289 [Mauremys mutica]|uniref:Uncharacterized protein n=1 Tax=Mauremys mutica TaxID=74926 RepID=A0A9D4B725_9SAUR|nr:hypothetical protein KIL84_014289 [Mauremys mutica]